MKIVHLNVLTTRWVFKVLQSHYDENISIKKCCLKTVKIEPFRVVPLDSTGGKPALALSGQFSKEYRKIEPCRNYYPKISRWWHASARKHYVHVITVSFILQLPSDRKRIG